MAYVVLARKWRPAQFSDIVGQSHIVRTLMNAIRSERLHHAYLFTGTRGTGKTSVARIFSKVLRCENTQWMKERPADQGAQAAEIEFLQSCDECSSCREIASSSSVDVMEIDGASNNGVEAVREIRENAKYMPSTGKRKIYIIDEVHMLTTAAFNALLKTLEEPPAHVTFIFATTEPHKIPATILSRVQRFDFRRVTLAQIQNRLSFIAQAEGIDAEPGALALIARAAEGSMRDSLSLLDQVIAFSGNQLTSHSVRESIGLVEAQTLLGILRAIGERKPLEALALVEQAYAQGHDLRVLTRSLVEFLHGAILAKAGAPNSGTLEFSPEQWAELTEIAALRELEELELVFQALHHGMEWIARSPQPKIILDVLLIKCATAEMLSPLTQAPAPGGPNAGSGAGASAPNRGAGPQRAQPPAGYRAEMMTDGPVGPNPPPHAFSGSFPGAGGEDMRDTAPMAPPSSPAAGIRAAIAALKTPPAQSGASKAVRSEKSAAPTPPVSAVPPLKATIKAGPKTWEGFIDTVRSTRPLLASILEHGSCEALPLGEPFVLAIVYDPKESYYREQLQSRVYHEQLVTIAKEYFGRPVPIRIDSKENHGGIESLAVRRERELREREIAARQAAENHPTIREARAIFGGELGPIELIDPTAS